MTAQPRLLLAHTVSPRRTAQLAPELESRLSEDMVMNAATPEETRELLPDAEFLVVGRFEKEWLDIAEDLQMVQTLWAGVDSYPLEAIESAGLRFANAAGVHAEPIAQQVIGYLLQFERGLLQTMRNQRRGVWESVEGGELGDDTLGIIGVGAIGSRVAELASPFGMEVIGTKRDLSETPDGIDELLPADEYRTLLGRSDYVVLACPLTDETEGLLGIDEFRLMNRDAVLVNVARGEIVEHDALVHALQYGLIRGAALDVFEEEPLPSDSVLWDLSNTVLTPHNSWTTPHTVDRWLEILEQNYTALADDSDGFVNQIL